MAIQIHLHESEHGRTKLERVKNTILILERWLSQDATFGVSKVFSLWMCSWPFSDEKINYKIEINVLKIPCRISAENTYLCEIFAEVSITVKVSVNEEICLEVFLFNINIFDFHSA